MRNVVLAAGLVTGLATASPVAAHPAHHYAGLCGFMTVSDGTDSDDTRWDGAAYVVVVATASDGQTPAPTQPITVECRLYVDGVFQQTFASATGVGAAAAVNVPFAFYADPEADVTVCEVVTVGGEAHETCPESLSIPIYPICGTCLSVDGLLADVDREICAAAASAAPGIPGVVDVTPEGDVYVAGEWFWDCPPYGSQAVEPATSVSPEHVIEEPR